jgi:triosephosphate isomerase (TIM)
MGAMVAANWKMNLPPEGVEAWVGSVVGREESEDVLVVVAPPFPFLTQLAHLGGGAISVAAQNLSEHEAGAYTGEVSAGMLDRAGCSHVIVGHSERRQIYGEGDELVGRKLRAAASAGLVPIFCIGETKELRDGGGTRGLLERQIGTALRVAGTVDGLVVAYEPVWAIGTGDNATPEQVGETHAQIRDLLTPFGLADVILLYGGSVKPDNAAELAAVEGVDGFLVGGASLTSESFKAIWQAMVSSRA